MWKNKTETEHPGSGEWYFRMGICQKLIPIPRRQSGNAGIPKPRQWSATVTWWSTWNNLSPVIWTDGMLQQHPLKGTSVPLQDYPCHPQNLTMSLKTSLSHKFSPSLKCHKDCTTVFLPLPLRKKWRAQWILSIATHCWRQVFSPKCQLSFKHSCDDK